MHLQRITERTAQMLHSRNTRGSRIVHCGVSKIICHPSVTSHMLPHFPQNTSARSLSLTPLVFRPSSPGPQKRFQYCVVPFHADSILYIRAIHGHEENTSILHCKTTCCYRVSSPSTSTTLKTPRYALDHSICIDTRWQRRQERRHAVFFAAVNPMYIDHYREKEHDVTQPRIAVYKQRGHHKLRRENVFRSF